VPWSPTCLNIPAYRDALRLPKSLPRPERPRACASDGSRWRRGNSGSRLARPGCRRTPAGGMLQRSAAVLKREVERALRPGLVP
jgi:hypothetical protein